MSKSIPEMDGRLVLYDKALRDKLPLVENREFYQGVPEIYD
mgnify:CR=1 FL=1